MYLVPWHGDVFMLLNLKDKPKPPWWAKTRFSWTYYEKFFYSLDPADWKQHDFYKILRLDNKRFFSTTEEIVKSYRVIARRFHPDKKPGSDRNYPSVIKASSILLDAASRRAYDSVDPALDDSIPKEDEAKAHIEANSIDKNAFFDIFRPVFERNAHWSIKQPVPALGDWYTPDEYIDNF